jgi:hypothetical protein
MAHDVGQGSYIKFGSILGSNPGTHYRVTTINWSGIQRDEPADVSHLLSAAREFIAGETYDPGEVSAEIQFDPALDFVSAMKSAATNQVVTLVFANGGTSLRAWSAYGQLQSFEAGATRDEMMTGTVTIKLSGEIGTAAVS